MAHFTGEVDRSRMGQRMADVMMGCQSSLAKIGENPENFEDDFRDALLTMYALAAWSINLDEEIKRREGGDCHPTFELIERMRKIGENVRRSAAENC